MVWDYGCLRECVPVGLLINCKKTTTYSVALCTHNIAGGGAVSSAGYERGAARYRPIRAAARAPFRPKARVPRGPPPGAIISTPLTRHRSGSITVRSSFARGRDATSRVRPHRKQPWPSGSCLLPVVLGSGPRAPVYVPDQSFVPCSVSGRGVCERRTRGSRALNFEGAH